MKKQLEDPTCGVFMKDFTKQYTSFIYRTHSYLDLLFLGNYSEAANNGGDLYLNLSSLLSMYEGHTSLSLFIDNPPFE